jgi:hypothetical protein
MSCIRFFGPIERRVFATSTTEIFYPFTDWMPAQGVDRFRATLRLLADSGLIQARIAFQTATAVINEGGAGGRNEPEGGGSATNAEMSVIDASVSPGAEHWIRWGVYVSLSQAGPPGQADVVLSLAVPGCASALGRFAETVHIGGNTSPAVVPVTAWVPAFQLEAVSLALVVQGVAGSLETQGMIQTADVDASSPNAWVSLGTSASGARKECLQYAVTSVTDPGVGTKPMLVRLGLSFKLASGTSEAYASVGIDATQRRG